MNTRTKQVKRKFLIFGALSLLLFVGVAIFAIISVFIKTGRPDITSTGVVETVYEVADTKVKVLSEEFTAKIVGFGLTAAILLIISLFISNKIKGSVWIMSLIISTIIYGEVAMYIIAAIYVLDEYCFYPLAKSNRTKLIMNKEIDKREGAK